MSSQNADVNPDIKWAIDLLTPDPDYEENFISRNYPWIFWPFLTLGGVAYTNHFQGRPMYASLRRYAFALVGGLTCAKIFKDAKWHREAERDAVLRHYIKLHPEDFIQPERKKWADTFQFWVPCR